MRHIHAQRGLDDGVIIYIHHSYENFDALKIKLSISLTKGYFYYIIQHHFMGYILLILFWLGWHIGIYLMLKKAGVSSAKAIIPIYNTWEVVKLCGISKMWFWIQLIPILGQFVKIGRAHV